MSRTERVGDERRRQDPLRFISTVQTEHICYYTYYCSNIIIAHATKLSNSKK